MHGSNTVQLERCDDLVDERDFFGGGVHKRHVELGSHDLQDQSGKPRAGTYVYQTQRAFASIAARFGEVVELRDHGDRIQKEPLLDLFGFSDRREIELCASFQE